MKLSDSDAVNQLIQGLSYLFLNKIYPGKIPQAQNEVYLKFYYYATLYCKKTMTQKAEGFKKQMIEKGIIGREDNRPLSPYHQLLSKCQIITMMLLRLV